MTLSKSGSLSPAFQDEELSESTLQARALPCTSTMPLDEGGVTRPRKAASFGQLGAHGSLCMLSFHLFSKL